MLKRRYPRHKFTTKMHEEKEGKKGHRGKGTGAQRKKAKKRLTTKLHEERKEQKGSGGAGFLALRLLRQAQHKFAQDKSIDWGWNLG